MKYIVFYIRGGRFASGECTKEKLDYYKSKYCLSLIQRDIDGTEHYDILGIR